jgi:hypothetical protein
MPRQPTRQIKDRYGGAGKLWKTAFWHELDVGDTNAPRWWATDNAALVSPEVPRIKSPNGAAWQETENIAGLERLLRDADPNGARHPGPFAARYSKVVDAGSARMGQAASPTGPAFIWRGDRLVAVVMPERVMPSGRGAKKPRLTSLQKRFKYIHDTYPPQVFVTLLERVMGPAASYSDLEFGAWSLRRDLLRQGWIPEKGTEADAAQWMLDELLRGRHWSLPSPMPVPETSGLEPILPWAAARLNRLLRKPDPKDLPRRRYPTPPDHPYDWPEVEVRGTDLVGGRWGAVTVTGEFVPTGTAVTVENQETWSPEARRGQHPYTAHLDGRVIAFKNYVFQPKRLNPDQWARAAGSKRLLAKLHEIAHWQAATHADIGRLTHRQALTRQARWHGGTPRGLGPGKHAPGGVKVADVDGWSLWKLDTSDAIRSEGAAMGHCLGKISDQFQRLHSGRSEFYSLRDDKGRSRISFELGVSPSAPTLLRRLVQAKGPGNRPPGVKKSVARRVYRSHLPVAEALEGFARRSRTQVIDWEEIEKLEQAVTVGPASKILPDMYGHHDGMGLSLMWALRDRGDDDWRLIGQGKPVPAPKGRASRWRRGRR